MSLYPSPLRFGPARGSSNTLHLSSEERRPGRLTPRGVDDALRGCRGHMRLLTRPGVIGPDIFNTPLFTTDAFVTDFRRHPFQNQRKETSHSSVCIAHMEATESLSLLNSTAPKQRLTH
ncbi:unnamed protein product [Pleuronectes platessa]|uniref:Uncharacterized protein n=1 Tax=Pleuronectes platessa TaxID=8262 RepID=A0A9N7VRJ0_PLEPL|nr:unnamed protein product [Pleuronectes platessa]